MKQQNLSIWKERFKTVGSIISWASLVILIAIAAFLLYVGVSTKLYQTRGSEFEPKFSLYTIISPSMEPNLNVYDTIVDKRVDEASEVEKNDIITFISSSSLSSGETVTHRVVDIIKNDDGTVSFQTKGDNNDIPDSAYVSVDDILGRVILRIPQLGRIQFFLANKGGWLLLIVFPSIIVLIRYVIKLIRLTKIKEQVDQNTNVVLNNKPYNKPEDIINNLTPPLKEKLEEEKRVIIPQEHSLETKAVTPIENSVDTPSSYIEGNQDVSFSKEQEKPLIYENPAVLQEKSVIIPQEYSPETKVVTPIENSVDTPSSYIEENQNVSFSKEQEKPLIYEQPIASPEKQEAQVDSFEKHDSEFINPNLIAETPELPKIDLPQLKNDENQNKNDI